MENKVVEVQENQNNESVKRWRLFFLYPIALILLFEEWGWEPLAALFDRLARHPVWARIERQIIVLPPWSVLFVFSMPVVALLPLKILAIYLFGKGHVIAGSLLLIGAKVFGTAICARLFQLTRPALMKIKWFSRWYPRWKIWKDNVLRIIRKSALWHNMQKMKLKIKVWWARVHLLSH